MSGDIRLATVDARGSYEIPRCGSRVRSTDVEKLRERAASTESLAAVARRNQARRTASRPTRELTPRRSHYLQAWLSRRDPFCTESIRGGIGLNHAPVELFANQSPFGVVPGTNRSGLGKVSGPGTPLECGAPGPRGTR